MSRKLKILFATPEAQPYAKSGGLADVAGALPQALNKLGHDIRVIMPRFKSTLKCPLGHIPLPMGFEIPVGPKKYSGTLSEGKLEDGTPVYLVANDKFFLRDGLYGDADGDYPDNAERFIFFVRTIFEACRALDFRPDIIHCNEWQTGLLPAYLKTVYATDDFFSETRSVMSIHNLAFQGNFPASTLALSGLPESVFTTEGLEFYGQVNFLKSGLVFSDLLSAVSPTYSSEIQTEEFGCGLDGVLRHRTDDLKGILNGVDYNEWNPATDPLIHTKFSTNKPDGKQACKKALIDRFSLNIDITTPILCMVTRLTSQKGIDLVLESMDRLMAKDLAVIILGTGESHYETQILAACNRYPGKLASLIGFGEKASHQIIAGSDIILIPSQYEPCGLTQLYGLRYGTVPLVRSVGGLSDSIQEFNPKARTGTGFKFKPYESDHLIRAAEKALSLYGQKKLWLKLMTNGMQKDFSWTQSAKKYTRLYHKALDKPRQI